MKRLPRKDVAGERIRIGDIVRIIDVPDLSGMSEECRAVILIDFTHLVGTYKRVEEFDEYGQAWLRFKIRNGPHAGYHLVGIEPYFLRVRRKAKSGPASGRRRTIAGRELGCVF